VLVLTVGICGLGSISVLVSEQGCNYLNQYVDSCNILENLSYARVTRSS
jgi:hypothetical protein